MSLETDLVAALQAVCPRVYPNTAPLNAASPFVTYIHIGGPVWRYADNTAADKRMAWLQIEVWATTYAEALSIIRQAETALCASVPLNARPQSEPTTVDGSYEGMYGLMQDFEVVAER